MKTIQKNKVLSADGRLTYFGGYMDEHGNPVERTKHTHPYSYDGFVSWRCGENSEVDNTVYSDRLSQWDYEKTKKLKLKHFGDKGDYWSGRTPEKIEAFLREYLEKPNLKLIFIMEYCNASSGYPVWRFDFKTN